MAESVQIFSISKTNLFRPLRKFKKLSPFPCIQRVKSCKSYPEDTAIGVTENFWEFFYRKQFCRNSAAHAFQQLQHPRWVKLGTLLLLYSKNTKKTSLNREQNTKNIKDRVASRKALSL